MRLLRPNPWPASAVARLLLRGVLLCGFAACSGSSSAAPAGERSVESPVTTPAAGTPAATVTPAVAAAAEERWYVVELLGERVGFAHEQEALASWEGRTVRRLRSEMGSRMTRETGGRVETLESRARVDWFETAAGEVLGFESEIGQPGNLVSTRGRREGDALALEITTSAGIRRETVAWDAGLTSPSAADAAVKELVARGAGEVVELRTFSPESGNAVLTVRVRVTGHETLADGSRGTWIEQELVGTGMVTRELRDGAGEVLRQEIGPMRLVRSNRDEAMRPIAASLAAFRGLTVQLAAAPRVPRAARLGRYRLKPRAGSAGDGGAPLDLATLFRLDGRQRIEGDELVVDTTRAANDPPTAAHLAPSSLVESDDEEIRAAASSALGGRLPDATAAAGAPTAGEGAGREFPAAATGAAKATDVAKATEVFDANPGAHRGGEVGVAVARARALERWVHEHVRFRGSGLGMATARQTLDSGDGDCTEHAALLAALLRAAAVPSRLVVGLVAVDGGGEMMPHAWVEAWTGEAWLPLDAAIYTGEVVDATHLAMAVSDGGDVGALLDLAAPLARGLGRFDLTWVP